MLYNVRNGKAVYQTHRSKSLQTVVIGISRNFQKRVVTLSEEPCSLRYSVYIGNEMGKIQHFWLIIIEINVSCKVQIDVIIAKCTGLVKGLKLIHATFFSKEQFHPGKNNIKNESLKTCLFTPPPPPILTTESFYQ